MTTWASRNGEFGGRNIGTTDLDMLANDIADLLDRNEYGIDATAATVRSELPAFLDRIAIGAANNVQREWESAGDAARWTPTLDVSTDPGPQPGPAPAMTHQQWWQDQGVELGQARRGHWYWRCPVCRIWAGPYHDVTWCKRVGMDHRYDAHDLPAERRSEARKAARRLAGAAMTAAVFDEMVARVAAAHAQPAGTVHLIIGRIANVFAGHCHADDLVAAIVRYGLLGNPEPTRRLVLDVASELGVADRLLRMGV